MIAPYRKPLVDRTSAHHSGARSAGALAIVVLGCLALAPRAVAEEPQVPDLRRDVLPLLRARCVKCHSLMKRESGLNLSSPRSLARGGESGPAVVAGQPDASLLWERISTDEMPPERPLAAEEKKVIQAWIAAGAPGLPTAAEAAQPGPDHWAFVPPRLPALPALERPEPARNDIDHFVLAELERRGLSIAPEAAPNVLLRRVSFDLTGLPPTPEEMALYLGDREPGAYERMVERYLASPRYGERWGQHWLDAAGYADSNGYFNADSDRPLAYRYRDYVIAAMNKDKPFDQFLREQIAGDELAGFTPSGDVTPEMVEPLTATHFLRNAPDGTGESDGNPDEQRADRFTVLEGTMQIIGSSLLGMTVQCARCHDHKFEPITQREYYELQSILWPAYCPDDWRKPNERKTTIASQSQRDEYARKTKELDEQIKALEDELAAASKERRQHLADARLAALDEAGRQHLEEVLKKPAKTRSEEERELVKAHEAETELNEEALAERFAEYAQAHERISGQIAELKSQRPAPLEELAILFDLDPARAPHHLLERGDYRALGAEVSPGVPRVLSADDRGYSIATANEHSSGRRLALAGWLTDPRHPIVARVTANRIWQQHFGRGIVATADNFGYTGAPPTHPELLDYLAVEFVQGGWSMKSLHRLILASATYRQSSAASEATRQADPDNLLLSRFALRRLDAEAIRDAMLRVSGELDVRDGGPYVPTTRIENGEVVVADGHDGAARRSVYLQRRRTQISSMLDVFDAPQGGTNCTRRNASTIALQSLSLLNSEFVTQRAQAMAARLTQKSGDDDAALVREAILLAWGRPATAGELAAAQTFFAAQPAAYPDQSEAKALACRDLCQMLLASNAFLYIE